MVKAILVASKAGVAKGQAKQIKAFMNQALTPAELQQLILAAADLHEESFDASSSHHRSHYRLNEMEAATLACELLQQDRQWAELIGLSLSTAWNDIFLWAGDHAARKPIVTIPADFVFPSREPVKSPRRKTAK